MRILVVEDDPYIAQTIAAILGKQQHYLVDIAPNGQNGWELATAFNYDLICNRSSPLKKIKGNLGQWRSLPLPIN
jgi:chemotaxis response regulator CheB